MIKRLAVKLFKIFKLYFLVEKLDFFLIQLFSLTPFLSSLYFLFFSRSFDREHHATLQGIARHKKLQGLINSSHVRLRRNIHRLEKGLIMKEKRQLFAMDYIAETMIAFQSSLENPNHDVNEILWAYSTLEKYFKSVAHEKKIIHAYNQFLILSTLVKNLVNDSEKNRLFPSPTRNPYNANERIPSPVNYFNFKQLCIRRRSVRWFSKISVPKELIEQAIFVASLAPSACNRQPFVFHSLEGKLAQVAAEFAPGTSGYANNIPQLIVLVGDLSYYESLRDKHLIYIDGSLAAMQFMLALETLGLSSCPINWPDVDVVEKKMTKLLGLKAYERPIMLIGVGYADTNGQIPYSQKKPVHLLTNHRKEEIKNDHRN